MQPSTVLAAIHVNFIMIGLQYRFKVSVYQLSVQSEVSTYNWNICIKFAPSSVLRHHHTGGQLLRKVVCFLEAWGHYYFDNCASAGPGAQTGGGKTPILIFQMLGGQLGPTHTFSQMLPTGPLGNFFYERLACSSHNMIPHLTLLQYFTQLCTTFFSSTRILSVSLRKHVCIKSR